MKEAERDGKEAEINPQKMLIMTRANNVSGSVMNTVGTTVKFPPLHAKSMDHSKNDEEERKDSL